MRDVIKYLYYLESLNLNFYKNNTGDVNFYYLNNLSIRINKLFDQVDIVDVDKRYLFHLSYNNEYNVLILTTNKILKPFIRKQKLKDLLYE